MCTDYIVVYSLFISWKVYYSFSFTDIKNGSIKPVSWNLELQISFWCGFMAGKITSFQRADSSGCQPCLLPSKALAFLVITSTYLRCLLWRRVVVLMSVYLHTLFWKEECTKRKKSSQWGAHFKLLHRFLIVASTLNFHRFSCPDPHRRYLIKLATSLANAVSNSSI